MKKHTLALVLVALAAQGCSDDSAGANNAGGGGFGTLTPEGPRVSGARLGMVSAGGSMGVGYDLDGDGDPEEIDIDGDGISDGEDIDGDGTITVWDNLRQGDVPSDPRAELPSVDPDLFRRLDPNVPVANAGPDGQVNEPGAVMNALPTDLLRSRSQGGQGSCAAFTVAAAATLVRRNYESMSNPMVNTDAFWASPSWLYARMVRDRMGMCNQGTTLGDGLNNLVTTGAASWAEQPYRSGDMPTLCESIDDTTAMAPHRFRIGGHTNIRGTGMAFRARVRESLAAGVPVVFGVNLPEGFMEFRATTQNVNVREPFRGTGMCQGSNHCGGHAMLIVGYDDSKSAYRVLNSWGTDWGDGGYLWWDYAALEGLQNLHASVILPMPAAPTALGAPDAMGLTLTMPMGSQPVVTQQVINAGESPTWTMIVRGVFNEPVTVTRLRAEIDGSGFNFDVNTALSYGDLTFLLPGDGAPAMGTAVTLTVTAKLRNGTMVDRNLMVMAPAPTMTP
ncbi:MAG: C1 family peptidase [Myxococcales bacterium]|nr:C1 family peptidase [Myxococcales bacterium]